MEITAYTIRNHLDALVYVGSTGQTLKKRMKSHRAHAKISDSMLHSHMAQLGVDEFYIETLESQECAGADERFIFEQGWIGLLQPQLNSQRAYQPRGRAVHSRANKKYYVAHAGKPHRCECGRTIVIQNANRHKRSQIHAKLLSQLSDSD